MIHPSKWKYETIDWKNLINRLYNSQTSIGNDLEFLKHTIIDKKPKSTFKKKPDVVFRFDCLNQKTVDCIQTECTLLMLENYQHGTTIYRLKQILNSPKFWPSLKKIEFVFYNSQTTKIIVDMYSNLYDALLPYMKDYQPLPGSMRPPIFLVPGTDTGLEISKQLYKYWYFKKRGNYLHYPWLGRVGGYPNLIVNKWNDNWFGKRVKKVILILSKITSEIPDLISQFERIGTVDILLIPNSYKYKRPDTFQIKGGKWIDDVSLVHLEKFQLVFRECGNFMQSSDSLISNISSKLPIELRWNGERKENEKKLIPADLCRIDSF